jgi:cold shock CspA family protein
MEAVPHVPNVPHVAGPLPPGRRERPLAGTVVAFDRARGLGTVVDAAGRELAFHATAIADGTRSIEPGTAVHFVVVAGHGGRLEARGLEAASPRG